MDFKKKVRKLLEGTAYGNSSEEMKQDENELEDILKNKTMSFKEFESFINGKMFKTYDDDFRNRWIKKAKKYLK